MPQVAFFPLWEIKRFNSPCLSTLIIIISPSSPVVCVLRHFPSPENPLHPLSLSLHPSSAITPYSLSKFSGSFPNLVFVFSIQMWGERRRAAVQIIISRRQGCYWDAMKLSWRTESDLVSCRRTMNHWLQHISSVYDYAQKHTDAHTQTHEQFAIIHVHSLTCKREKHTHLSTSLGQKHSVQNSISPIPPNINTRRPHIVP